MIEEVNGTLIITRGDDKLMFNKHTGHVIVANKRVGERIFLTPEQMEALKNYLNE